MTAPRNLCNVDGEICPEHEARVPVMDRGFLFGDSVYEVLRVEERVPLAWREHLDRLAASARRLGFPGEIDRRETMARAMATLEASGRDDAYVRVIVTRGTGTAPNIDIGHGPGPLRSVILVRELPDLREPTGRLALVERLRNDRRALDPAIKSGNYLNNVLGLAEARAAGADDAVFLNARGEVTEASTSNVWIVRGGVLQTPALSSGMLAGITRALLLRFCAAQGLPHCEQVLHAADLLGADEVFLTSTLRDAWPIVEIDGKAIGDREPGPVTRDLQQRFSAYLEAKRTEEDAPALQALLRG